MSSENVRVEIATPKGMFVGDFPKTAKIQDIIRTVASEKGLNPSDGLELVHEGTVLQPEERPLVSFGLEGTVSVELVAQGSGV